MMESAEKCNGIGICLLMKKFFVTLHNRTFRRKFLLGADDNISCLTGRFAGSSLVYRVLIEFFKFLHKNSKSSTGFR